MDGEDDNRWWKRRKILNEKILRTKKIIKEILETKTENLLRAQKKDQVRKSLRYYTYQDGLTVWVNHPMLESLNACDVCHAVVNAFQNKHPDASPLSLVVDSISAGGGGFSAALYHWACTFRRHKDSSRIEGFCSNCGKPPIRLTVGVTKMPTKKRAARAGSIPAAAAVTSKILDELRQSQDV